jgi:pimeloyl-ACP methyl ester carboxylesterase
MQGEKPEFLTVGTGEDARDIAWRLLDGPKDRPALVWLGGYRSDMKGTKAVELESHARETGLACLRLDYSGHGESGGEFRDGTISRWLAEALAVIDHAGFQRLILIGSSMGGWIALRAVQELRARGSAKVEGMVLIAPAPDFTMELIEPSLSDVERTSLAEKGYFEEHSDYSPEPNIFTAKLMEDGRANRVLTGIIETGCPVHILQGMKDPDVPWRHAMKLVEHLPADDVVISLVKDGDHRLSRPEDLALMRRALDALAHG